MSALDVMIRDEQYTYLDEMDVVVLGTVDLDGIPFAVMAYDPECTSWICHADPRQFGVGGLFLGRQRRDVLAEAEAFATRPRCPSCAMPHTILEDDDPGCDWDRFPGWGFDGAPYAGIMAMVREHQARLLLGGA